MNLIYNFIFTVFSEQKEGNKNTANSILSYSRIVVNDDTILNYLDRKDSLFETKYKEIASFQRCL